MRDVGTRRAAAIAAIAGVICIVVVTWLGTLPPGFSMAARSPLDATLILLTAVSALAIGLVDWLRNPAGTRSLALALAGVAWSFSAGVNPGSGSAIVFTLALVLPYASTPLLAQVGFGTVRNRVGSGVTPAVIGAIWLGAVVLAGIVPALLFQPDAAGCRICPQNLLGAISNPGAAGTVRDAGLIVMALGSGVAIAWLVIGMLRSTRPAQSVALPIVAPVIAGLALAILNASIALPRHEAWPDQTVWRASALTLVATALGVAVGWARTTLTRQRIARLAIDIADSPVPGALRGMLAAQLSDPDLAIVYPVGDGRAVGADGRAVLLGSGLDRQVTQITQDGVVVALLEHRRGLSDDSLDLDEVVRAARLAIENERLQAVSRARLEDLRMSRRLVVEADDAARRQLERDLHDGAQQRLVSLALALQLVRTSLGRADSAMTDALDAADKQLRSAIDGLRGVAHGLYPAVLAEEGLGAGVDSLRESSTVPIRVVSMPLERLPHAVEVAAWFTIVEATRDIEDGGVTVSVRRGDGELVLDITRDAPDPPDLSEVEDRIGALDGTVNVTSIGGSQATVHAVIPCAS